MKRRSPAERDDSLDAAVAAASRGCKDAFGSLWEELNPPLLRYLKVREPNHAEDLAGETWLAVVKGIQAFDGNGRAFKSWLFTIARSKIIDNARSQGRRPVTLVDSWTGIEPVDPLDVAAAAIESQTTADALRLLATLPADQAEIVALRVLADFDVATVAKIVGKSAGAVRVAQHRGIQRLAAVLDATAVRRNAEADDIVLESDETVVPVLALR